MTHAEREAWDLLRRIDAVEARLVDQSRRWRRARSSSTDVQAGAGDGRAAAAVTRDR